MTLTVLMKLLWPRRPERQRLQILPARPQRRGQSVASPTRRDSRRAAPSDATIAACTRRIHRLRPLRPVHA
ncbi:MAG TPA: hypothetical protein PLT35_08580, partial [Vicinamibacterales bacterium]|nr:hypothetical protein [Vicinamibacterales bacterium]